MLDFTEFYLVLLDCILFYRVLLGFDGFSLFIPDFIVFLPGFTYFIQDFI